jgi:hypothetical protein
MPNSTRSNLLHLVNRIILGRKVFAWGEARPCWKGGLGFDKYIMWTCLLADSSMDERRYYDGWMR